MPKKEKVGALWAKTTEGGKTLWNGVVKVDGKEVRIDVWPNDYKTESKHPDFVIYKNDWKPKTRPKSDGDRHVGSPPSMEDEGDADEGPNDSGVPF